MQAWLCVRSCVGSRCLSWSVRTGGQVSVPRTRYGEWLLFLLTLSSFLTLGILKPSFRLLSLNRKVPVSRSNWRSEAPFSFNSISISCFWISSNFWNELLWVSSSSSILYHHPNLIVRWTKSRSTFNEWQGTGSCHHYTNCMIPFYSFWFILSQKSRGLASRWKVA